MDPEDSLVYILSQMGPVCVPEFFIIHFNFVLPSILYLLNNLFHSEFTSNIITNFSSHNACYMSHQSRPPLLDHSSNV
jgi:hypothetical protein